MTAIERIFSIEEDSEILKFRTYDDIPLWMMARYYFLYNVLFSRMLGFASPTRLREINGMTFSTVFKAAVHNTIHSAYKKEKQILFYTTNRKTIVESKYFNRYTDHLAMIYPDNTVTIEQALLNWEWPFPRVNNCVLFDVNSRIVGELKARFSYNRDIAQIIELVDYIVGKARELCGVRFDEADRETFVSYISKVVLSMRYQAEWIERQTTKETKIVIMIGGAYPFSYPINVVLKGKGIKTADLQHGYITKSNLMYNYSRGIVNHPDVIRGLPNYFLTYGEYWNTQFNCPSKKITIGNPYNDYSIKYDFDRTDDEPGYITLFGTGENTENYISLTEYLSIHVSKGYRVKYRPHPGERKYVEDYIKQKGINIEIDSNVEVYDSLKESDIIISEISTVLFEAVGIVKRILVWQTNYSLEYFPDPPFEVFSRFDDIMGLLDSDEKIPNYYRSEFWDSNWEQKYRDFVGLVTK